MFRATGTYRNSLPDKIMRVKQFTDDVAEMEGQHRNAPDRLGTMPTDPCAFCRQTFPAVAHAQYCAVCCLNAHDYCIEVALSHAHFLMELRPKLAHSKTRGDLSRSRATIDATRCAPCAAHICSEGPCCMAWYLRVVGGPAGVLRGQAWSLGMLVSRDLLALP